MRNIWNRLMFFIVAFMLVNSFFLKAGLREDTQILTPTGLVPLKVINKEDMVVGYNPTDGTRVPVRIESIIARLIDQAIMIHVGEHKLCLSPDQLVYDVMNHVLKPAAALGVGDLLLTQGGQAMLCAHRELIQEPTVVYNIKVEQPYLFFTSSAQVLTASHVERSLDDVLKEPGLLDNWEYYYSVCSPVLSIAMPVASNVITIAYAGYCVFRFGKHLHEAVQDKRAKKNPDRARTRAKAARKKEVTKYFFSTSIPERMRKERERDLRIKDMSHPELLARLLFDDEHVQHYWHRVVPSNDPALIVALIDQVMEEGRVVKLLDQQFMMMKISSYYVMVRYEVVRGIKRIRNAFVYDSSYHQHQTHPLVTPACQPS